MNDRERVKAVLNYETPDRLPVVHFGFWEETVEKWRGEGHIADAEAKAWRNGLSRQAPFCERLGFDFEWGSCRCFPLGLFPAFDPLLVEELPDGSRKIRNSEGVTELFVPGLRSIPSEFDHLLKDRASYEEHFKPRLQLAGRVDEAKMDGWLADRAASSAPIGLFCGSMIGSIRNWLGVENLSYLPVDDEALFKEIVETVGNIAYDVTERTLELAAAKGLRFDYGHFWEDICYKNGPLVTPSLFDELCGPHYKRICGLLAEHGVDVVTLDCDGMIDALIPTWLDNGVNAMFPIEVGTWNASIAPWREKYGRAIRGVGGMDKRVFALDEAAVEAEIERLKPLVALGGYIPCPDHRIAPDAKWELVQYYCRRMREEF